MVWKLPPHNPFGTTQAQQDPDQDGIVTNIPLRFAGQVFDVDDGWPGKPQKVRLPMLALPSVAQSRRLATGGWDAIAIE